MGTKIGIFSGSFNPIHIGHLALANWLCAYEELDEVWFVITPHNPLKQKEQWQVTDKKLITVQTENIIIQALIEPREQV